MESASTCRAVLDGRDLLEIFEENGKIRRRAIGCEALLSLVAELRARDGDDPAKWTLPEGPGHAEILVREFILRARGEWAFPYPHDELCHCRMIPARVVDQAIIAGAHTPEAVSRATSASTACGTCRPDVEKILEYRLRKSS